jgi:hypothetical protein
MVLNILTDGVEDDTGFQNHNTENVLNVMMVMTQAGESRLVGSRRVRSDIGILGVEEVAGVGDRGGLVGSLVENNAISEILEHKSQENASHGNRAGCSFVLKGAQARITKHERRMCVKLYIVLVWCREDEGG